MKVIKLVPILGLLALLCSCASSKNSRSERNVTRETTYTGEIQAISIASNVNVLLTDIPKGVIVIEGPESAVDRVLCNVNNGTLMVTGAGKAGIRTVVKVSAPSLSAVTISGAGNVTADHSIDAAQMVVRIAGSGLFAATDINAGSFNLMLAGEGKCRIEGILTSEKNDLRIAGSGETRINRMEAGSSQIILSGPARFFMDHGEIGQLTFTAAGNTRSRMGGMVDEMVCRLSGRTNADMANLVVKQLKTSVAGNKFTYSYNAADDARVVVSGAGLVSAYGQCDEVDVRIAGSAVYRGESMTANNLTIAQSGTCSATCTVSEQIKSTMSGSGNLTVFGTCDTANFRKAGSATLDARNLKARKASVISNGKGRVYINTTEELTVATNRSTRIYNYGQRENVQPGYWAAKIVNK